MAMSDPFDEQFEEQMATDGFTDDAPADAPADDNCFDDFGAEAVAQVEDAGDDPFGDVPVEQPAAPAEDANDFDFCDMDSPKAAAPADDNCFDDSAPTMGGGMDMGGMDMGGMDMGGMGGMDMGGMGDMSSAFVTTANMAATGPLAEWRSANEQKIAERSATSRVELEKIQAQAKEDRDNFYAARTANLDASKKAHRDAESQLKDSRQTASVKENLWESVMEMVDVQTKTEGEDITRMRQTMLAMKNEDFNQNKQQDVF